MAKQDGIIKIKGTVDDLTFANTKDGYQVRKKTRKVSKETFASDPKYARLRENMSEFTRATNGSKLMRVAVNEALLNCSDRRFTTRLSKEMMKVIKSDAISDRGKRTIMNGDATLLKDFVFNNNAVLSIIFKPAVTATIDRVTGKLSVEIPAFIPEDAIIAPHGTTHFKFHCAATDINFDTGKFVTKMADSAGIKNDDRLLTAPFTLQHDLNANSTNPLFLLLGIRFYMEVNGKLYPSKDGGFNSLSIIDVGEV